MNGFSIDIGITTPSMEEAKIVRKVIKGARKVVVLADHSKFNKVAFNRIATMDQIDIVITDMKTPADQINKLRNLGIIVIVAETRCLGHLPNSKIRKDGVQLTWRRS